MRFMRNYFRKTAIIINKYGLLVCLKYIIWYFEKYVLRKAFTCRMIQANKMYLDMQVGGVSKELAIWGIREEPKTLLLKEELEEGMVVADIGANIGYYTLMEASLVKKSGKVYAFEPDSRNLKLLKRNIELNGHNEIVEVYNTAVSDKARTSKIYMADETNLNTMLAPDKVDTYKLHKWRSAEVKTVSLDDFLRDKRPVNFIRMDIEGFEVEVFNGMTETVKNAPAKFKILFELHMHTYYLAKPNRMEPVLRRFFELGLRAKALVPDKKEAHKYKELGYKPDRVVEDRLGARGLYYNIKNIDDVISLTCHWPNSTKFMLLEKVK